MTQSIEQSGEKEWSQVLQKTIHRGLTMTWHKNQAQISLPGLSRTAKRKRLHTRQSLQ